MRVYTHDMRPRSKRALPSGQQCGHASVGDFETACPRFAKLPEVQKNECVKFSECGVVGRRKPAQLPEWVPAGARTGAYEPREKGFD